MVWVAGSAWSKHQESVKHLTERWHEMMAMRWSRIPLEEGLDFALNQEVIELQLRYRINAGREVSLYII